MRTLEQAQTAVDWIINNQSTLIGKPIHVYEYTVSDPEYIDITPECIDGHWITGPIVRKIISFYYHNQADTKVLCIHALPMSTNSTVVVLDPDVLLTNCIIELSPTQIIYHLYDHELYNLIQDKPCLILRA